MPGTRAADYDAMTYPGSAYEATHPSLVFGAAALAGFEAPAPGTARVLEVGCASGENLIPMALSMPEARFVGIDFSAAQIAAARALAGRLKLGNVQFECLDLRDLPASAGEFDYIIAHGVYSWVEAAVQDKLLDLCRAHLAPQGVALVSYNVFPGWHRKMIAREILVYEAQFHADPKTAVREAKAFVQFLAGTPVDPTGAYAHAMSEAVALMQEQPDASLRHDQMEAVNAPSTYTDFVAHAGRHGLQVLTDTQFVWHIPAPQNQTVIPALNQRAAGDFFRWEQYMDFYTGRPFRHSVLIHERHRPSRKPTLEGMRRVRLACAAQRTTEGPLPAKGAVQFRLDHGAMIQTDNALAQVAIAYLGQAWPGRPTYEEVTAEMAARAGTAVSAEKFESACFQSIAQAIWSGAVQAYGHAPAVCRTISARPTASALVRLQAPGGMVTSLIHMNFRMKSMHGVILPLLDGTRDRGQLVAELAAALERGEIGRKELESGAGDQRASGDLIAEALERFLVFAARNGLLVG